MADCKSLFILGAVACVALCSFANGASLDVACRSNGNNEHQKFFRKLQTHEQYALMTLAIANRNFTGGTNTTSLFPTHPFVKPKSEDIPRTLFTKMMNGEVPKNFMKKFIQWLKKCHDLTDLSLDTFATSEHDDRLCRDLAGQDCIHIDDAGSQCCPFG